MKRFGFDRFGALLVAVSAMALLAVGCGSDDNEDSPVTGTDMTAPNAPLGVAAAAGAPSDKGDHRYVDVDWSANAEADLAGYNVYWTATPANEASYEYLGYVPAGTESYQDEKAISYGYVHYKVTALDDSQNESERSQSAMARVAYMGGGGKGHNVEDPLVEPGD
jgi:hypothetical protein